MKRSFLSLIMFFVLCLQAQSSMVIVDYQGDTVVRQKNVERNLIINSDDDGVYDIAVRPMESELVSSDGNVRIPLENVYINNTKEDVYLRYNEYSNLFKDLTMGGVAKNMTAKIRDYGMVPAGTYNLNFEVQATNSETQEIASMTTFNLQFIVPVIQDINLNGEMPRITVNASDAFDPQKRISNEVSPAIQINSNSNWELAVNCDSLGEAKGNYYIRTVTATPNVFERLQERVLLEPGKEIIIAKGKAPADNESVTVEFSMTSVDGNYIPAGNYENRVKYILREDS